ncbi:MAG: DUF4299 family protein [Pseudomonadota bacterium]
MSYSFYVSGAGSANLQAVMNSLPFSDVESDVSVPTKGWPDLAHLYRRDVTVRAVETALEDDTVSVRIMSGATPADYQLATEIIKKVSASLNKPVVSEEGKELTAGDFDSEYGDDWIARHSKETLEMLMEMHRSGETGVMEIHGVNAVMKLGPEMLKELQEAGDVAEALFYERFRRLNYINNEDLFQASIIVGQNEKTGKIVRISTLGEDVATVFSTRAKVLAIVSPQDDLKFNVRFQDFVEGAGNHITRLSEDVVVTESISGEPWKALVAKLQPLALTDLFADESLLDDPEEPAADDTASFNSEKALIAAPAAVFLLVAAADGTIDKKEVNAFQKNVVKSLASDNESVQELTLAGLAQFQEILGGLQQGGPELCVSLLSLVRSAATDKMDEESATLFCDQLYGMGEAVAKASGGGFLGFGSKISAEEQGALDLIKKALSI